MTAAVLASCVIGLAAETAAAQEDVPACPDADEIVVTYPPAYARAGQSYSARVTMKGYRRPDRITDLAVTVTTASGERSMTPLQLNQAGSAKTIQAAPRHGRRFRLRFSWGQDLGTQQACVGGDGYLLPLVHRHQKVGDPGGFRLASRYRASYTRGIGTSIWKVRNTCDFFACAAHMRTNHGLAGTLYYRRRDGSYVIRDYDAHAANCRVTNTYTGASRIIPGAYSVRRVISLERFAGRGATARRVKGTVADHYIPTRRARRSHCRSEVRYARVNLVRR